MSRLKQIYNEAANCFVGGASAGQRYNAILKQPLYIKSANGSRFIDADGNEFIDYHTCAGAGLFGHNHPRVKQAIMKAIDLGFFLNFDTEYHVELATLLKEFFPSCELIRLANTGSEATQAAMRVARCYTKRDKIVKFEGHFHGMHENIWFNHNDVSEIDAHGEVQTTPDSQGFPENAKDNVVNALYNNIDSFKHVISKYKDQVAAVILEPISYNCGCYEAKKEFLEAVREICTRENIVLIFDEVICGLRMRPGSAQLLYGVIPDMTTMAKAIGGGLSIAAFGGRADIMNCLNPMGKAAVSGTYTGALMPVMSSIECLKMAKEDGFYDHLEEIENRLYSGIDELFKKHGKKGHCRGVGARFAIYFGVENPEDDFDFRLVAEHQDRQMYKNFVTECLKHGLWFHDTAGPVSPAHYGITVAHTIADIDETLQRLDKIFAEI